ncbi:MAG: hypothetical protein CMO55_22690 [Verrucomicrobiales bacterium]|nr:hypothetical protein [Verrucomicrobiales bacterium]
MVSVLGLVRNKLDRLSRPDRKEAEKMAATGQESTTHAFAEGKQKLCNFYEFPRRFLKLVDGSS